MGSRSTDSRAAGPDARSGPPRHAGKPLAKSQLVVAGRYTLFQLPELVIVVGAILVAERFEIVTAVWAGILIGVWILKEIVLFPFLRQAYEPSDPNATSHLIGNFGVVTKRLDPRGTVRIGPEFWQACVAEGHAPVERGARVCVKSVEGLTLHVESPPGG